MQRRNINNKQHGRNGGILRGADGNWSEKPRGTLEEQATGLAREEGLDAGNEVVGDALGPEGLAQDVGIHIVKPTFDVQEERGDSVVGVLESADCVD